MGHQDYFAPVHYDSPPRTPRRFPRWVLVALAVIVVTIGLGYAALWYLGRAFSKQMKELLPKPAVVIGQPLAWRELDHKAVAPFSAGMIGGLFVADFDGDGDEEVLAIQPQGRSSLYEADGSKSAVALNGSQFMLGAVSWDYDRDGIAEVVTETTISDLERGRAQGRSAEEIFLSHDLPVYNLAGGEVARLDAMAAIPSSMIVADIDGDGWQELIVAKPEPGESYGGNKLRAIGANGEQLVSFESAVDTLWIAAGDVDGDGREELIAPISRQGKLIAIGIDHQRETLDESLDGMRPLGCADLNGDGRAEVILKQVDIDLKLAYFDFVSKQLIKLEVPPALDWGE